MSAEDRALLELLAAALGAESAAEAAGPPPTEHLANLGQAVRARRKLWRRRR